MSQPATLNMYYAVYLDGSTFLASASKHMITQYVAAYIEIGGLRPDRFRCIVYVDQTLGVG
jgi:hypothetical protein